MTLLFFFFIIFFGFFSDGARRPQKKRATIRCRGANSIATRGQLECLIIQLEHILTPSKGHGQQFSTQFPPPIDLPPTWRTVSFSFFSHLTPLPSFHHFLPSPTPSGSRLRSITGSRVAGKSHGPPPPQQKKRSFLIHFLPSLAIL